MHHKKAEGGMWGDGSAIEGQNTELDACISRVHEIRSYEHTLFSHVIEDCIKVSRRIWLCQMLETQQPRPRDPLQT